VILVDVNLLIYATYRRFDQHTASLAWLNEQLSGSNRVGLPWATLLGFMRLATSARLLQKPMTTAEAWGQVTEWLSAANAWIPAPTERHAGILGQLLSGSGIHGKLVPDAHLAALAIEHGLTLCSTDRDFARFRQLRWVNPLA
jgi:toxin-antitoxin system PIN domain toxin